MTHIDIDDDLYNELKAFVEDDKISNPTIKNYAERSLRASLSVDKKDRAVLRKIKEVENNEHKKDNKRD